MKNEKNFQNFICLSYLSDESFQSETIKNIERNQNTSFLNNSYMQLIPIDELKLHRSTNSTEDDKAMTKMEIQSSIE